MEKIIKIVISLVLISTIALSQGPPNGFPTGGNGNGGPPPPPPNYCDANPGDPVCNGAAVPIGDWKWQLGLILIGTAYAYYTFNKKSLIKK